jgi:hypothetical protein
VRKKRLPIRIVSSRDKIRPQIANIKFSLVENALDFIISGIKAAHSEDTKQLKYAILHISDGVELVLKERLVREHWTLLFADPNKANIENFVNGDFKSIEFNDCIERLQNVLKIDIRKHTATLDKLRRIRNKLQHFAFTGTKDEIISILVQTWNFIFDFLNDELPDIQKSQAGMIAEIKELMLEDENFIAHRMSIIQTKIDAKKNENIAVLECPRCSQMSFVVPGGDGAPYCLFCKYKTVTSEEAVIEWAKDILGPSNPRDWLASPSVHDCPECGAQALIHQRDYDVNPPDPGWVCFSCGAIWGWKELGFCDTCGRPYEHSEDDYGMCSDCMDEQMSRD